ncbi:hypothetical protein HY488_01885 [Candidatus Woesearchaeota archaeon]|nr:hypothetical protein [Candidatus Woesearchaeota archaeon]
MKKEQVICKVICNIIFFSLILSLFSSIVFADEGITIAQSTAKAALDNFGTVSGIALVFLAFGTIFWYKKFKQKSNWVWLWVSVLVTLGLGYSVLVFFAEGAEKGIVVCETPENCVIAMHIHATFDVEVCGEEKTFGLETGELSATHTHKEGAGNSVHFHERLPYDSKTETILDTTPLRVGNIFESLAVPFTSECLYDHCNGQTCSGKTEPGRVRMSVNDAENAQFQEYVWKDGDMIKITFE